MDMRRKIALFCNVQENAVISALDVPTIYEVPLAFHEQGLDELIVKDLELAEQFPHVDLKNWRELVSTIKDPTGGTVKIAIVGKYVELEDSYKSLREALTHAGVANDLRVNVTWIESENLMKDDYENELQDYDAILVPGGFGKRGIPGMLRAIKYARKSGTPYFGICLGMQTACIEFARNVCGLRDADSTEFNEETPFPIIFKLRDLVGVEEIGGTMRLGAWACDLKEGSLAAETYHGEADRSANATGIDSNSIPNFVRCSKRRAWCSAAFRPTASLSRWSSCRATRTRFSSRASSIRNTNRNRSAAHPLFAAFVKAAWENRLNSENLEHDVHSDRQPQTPASEAIKEMA